MGRSAEEEQAFPWGLSSCHRGKSRGTRELVTPTPVCHVAGAQSTPSRSLLWTEAGVPPVHPYVAVFGVGPLEGNEVWMRSLVGSPRWDSCLRRDLGTAESACALSLPLPVSPQPPSLSTLPLPAHLSHLLSPCHGKVQASKTVLARNSSVASWVGREAHGTPSCPSVKPREGVWTP